jgi:hypothetical protein
LVVSVLRRNLFIVNESLQSTQTDLPRWGVDPLQRILNAQRANAALLAPSAFARTIDAVEAEIGKLGVADLRGATEIGHVVAGAVIERAEGRLRLWMPGSPGPVLLLDGVIAGGARLSTVATEMKKLGVESVAAVVLGTVGVAVEAPLGIDVLVRITEGLADEQARLPKAA